MTLPEVRKDVESIDRCWRSQSATEQRIDVSYLDLLSEPDCLEVNSIAVTIAIIQLRARIEILMSDIDGNLGADGRSVVTEAM